jgi:hypothetical protein
MELLNQSKWNSSTMHKKPERCGAHWQSQSRFELHIAYNSLYAIALWA